MRDIRTKNTITTSLRAPVRFAIYNVCDSGMVGGPEVRTLVMEALAARGWDEARMRKEYALYQAKCIEEGQANEFTGEKV